MPLYGDKVADFRAFTERVLKQLKPKILILTGDLVDAKSKNMQGRQYEEEWKVGADPSLPPRGGRINPFIISETYPSLSLSHTQHTYLQYERMTAALLSCRLITLCL